MHDGDAWCATVASMVRWEALDALSHQLELCAIGAETRLVVLIDPSLERDQIARLQTAIERSGATAIEVHIAPVRCAGNEPLIAAVAAADLVITTGDHNPCGFDDTPVLHVQPVSPDQFAPHASLRRRVNALATSLGSASMLTLTDTNGTNLTVGLGSSSISLDHGFVSGDHPLACFPAGWVQAVPAAATVQGQLVLMPGDANLGAARLINSPVVLQLVGDHISAIEGDSPDADIVRALLEHPGEPAAYGMAGLSIGLNPGPGEGGVFDLRLLDPIISLLLAGVVRISFGENLVADRPCSQIVTMALRARTVHLDELPVVVDGRLEGEFAPDVYEL